MSFSSQRHLIAVDVGNSRLHAAAFAAGWLGSNEVSPQRATSGGSLRSTPGTQAQPGKLPEPQATLTLPLASAPPFDALGAWVQDHSPGRSDWVLASVNDTALAPLRAWLAGQGVGTVSVLDDVRRLPLAVELAAPEKAGIDRLLNAVAVNVIRPEGQAAIIVDAGSAVTIDCMSPLGAFRGGAILAGPGLQARALNEFTEKLPLVDVVALAGAPGPAPLGTSTREAMTSGIVWGTVGAVKELVERLAAELATEPLVVLTGGAAPLLADRLGRAARLLPCLTLQGIWLAAGDAGRGGS